MPNAPPNIAPINNAGANIPPEPPDPNVVVVANNLATRNINTSCRG
jgi:hypothetical protein